MAPGISNVAPTPVAPATAALGHPARKKRGKYKFCDERFLLRSRAWRADLPGLVLILSGRHRESLPGIPLAIWRLAYPPAATCLYDHDCPLGS